ncbi:hypothetical protein IV203_027754 [Nitzschia inconspicua]|uniref:Uncharacterized protein n=1 Tax=Nitzschia inconspicua TaxID=303405 RepID=A0A9K3LXV5_9STRA|nr:hypothetical protein IV203_027754 [Nitzschia inconspicua]
MRRFVRMVVFFVIATVITTTTFAFTFQGALDCRRHSRSPGSLSQLISCFHFDSTEETTKDSAARTRRSFLQESFVTVTVAGITTAAFPANAFDGGVGGLGKTKPQTGVKFFGDGSGPIQNDKGIVTAEIQSISGKPILVSFQTPWPLLTSSGLEARDLRNSESAFIQVVSMPKNDWRDKKVFEQLLLDSVLASTGKFGMYGQPYNVQVKASKTSNDVDGSIAQQQLFSVTFTTLTPAMRESERKAMIQCKQIDSDTLVLLVAGTTAARFPSNEGVLDNVVESFQAAKAPESKLR